MGVVSPEASGSSRPELVHRQHSRYVPYTKSHNSSFSTFLFSYVDHRKQGACIGVNAALISIITKWLSDVKMGYCSDGWWLNQQFCCWEIDGEGCAAWRPWSTVGAARWIIYVIFAVSPLYPPTHPCQPYCLCVGRRLIGSGE